MTSTDAQRSDLPTQYAPAEVEGALYARWEDRGYFAADPTSDKPPYSIVIPPPNVTGSLHVVPRGRPSSVTAAPGGSE